MGTQPNSKPNEPLLIRPDQAAHMLGVKPSWVYDAVRAGRLPYVPIGRHIRFAPESLRAWVAEQAVPARKPS